MAPKRAQHTVSYPLSSELAPSLASPPTTPPRGHKHSLSKSMVWLSRSSSSTSSHSAPRPAPKPTRISEPKVGSSLEHLSFHRGGPLGSGATIVRTPQEALSGSHHAFDLICEEEGVEGDILLHSTDKNQETLNPPPPSSPPLPPLPDISDEAGEDSGRLSGASTSIPLSDHVSHLQSSGSPSSAALFSSSKPTLVAHSRAPSRCMSATSPDVHMGLPQPPFEAVLLSSIPEGAIDPSKFIVTLETCTATYRTSLRSLVSRPSHLSRYLTSLLSPTSETASVYSNSSDVSSIQHGNGFNSLFRDHLASSGCIPQFLTNIHIFLDRPSAPYSHVLAYLRSLPSTPEQPEALPRAARLEPGSIMMAPSRLEALLELRDEACYLGLTELEKLCSHEINRFHRVPLQISAASGGAPRGKTGSVHSFHTVVEEPEPRKEVWQSARHVPNGDSSARTTESATGESSSSSPRESRDVVVRDRGKERRAIKYDVGSPPPGWI